MRREIGILLTAGGAALIWLLKGKLRGPEIHRRGITLTSKKGRCGITREPKPVKLRKSKGDQVHWLIKNPQNSGAACNGEIQVCLGNWSLNGAQVPAPVEDVQGGELCRSVPRPQTVPVHGKVKANAPVGTYYYDVLINGAVAVDPIVRIVDA